MGYAKVGPGCLFRLFLYSLAYLLLFLPSSRTNKPPTLGTRGYIPDSTIGKKVASMFSLQVLNEGFFHDISSGVARNRLLETQLSRRGIFGF